MSHPVGRAAELAGVTVRPLHRYDRSHFVADCLDTGPVAGNGDMCA
jgi:hypothetical protein